MKILLAGASGAIGRTLTPMLVAAGHEVFGAFRNPANADKVEALGASPVISSTRSTPPLASPPATGATTPSAR